MPFFAKAYELRYDEKTKSEYLYHPLGSSHSWSNPPLKSVNGFVRWIKRSVWAKNCRISKVEIYSYWNVFDENTYKLLRVIEEDELHGNN